VVGAVVGGLAGAVLGNQVGSGSGRAAATVLGGVGGAAVGSQYGGGSASAPVAPGATYRITVQTDQGVVRTYEVAQPGELRVGDRVRVENNVIYRS
jgi:outer membrane lipoprotein SlyB